MNNEPNNEEDKVLTEKDLEGVVGGHAVQVAGGLYVGDGQEEHVARIDGIDTRILDVNRVGAESFL